MHLIALIEILAQIYFIAHAVQNNKPRYWVFILLIPWIGFTAYIIMELIPAQQPNDKTNNPGIQACEIDQLEARNVAYLSQGRLFHKSNSLPPAEIQSRFGQKIVDQTIRAQQKHEWKTKGSGSYFGGSALWGVDQLDTEAVKVSIRSAAPASRADRLYFILESETTGGLFLYDCKSCEEKRLFHKENFRARDLDFNSEQNQLVCSQVYANGTSNIILISDDGVDIKEITEGDSIDEAPKWIPGNDRRILFQSSGIARNKDGYVVGRGPTSIQALDLDESRLTNVLEDSRYDYLQPQISADGYMYYIRRPHEISSYSHQVAIMDFFLLPFRLLRAFFHYLNFFSLVYSKKPLTTASGPDIKGDDLKSIMIRGRIIDAEKALRSGTKVLGVPSLVPASWKLVRRSQDNSEEVVAQNVAAFDIDAEGLIAYSNGRGIFALNPQKGHQLILKDNLVEDVVIG